MSAETAVTRLASAAADPWASVPDVADHAERIWIRRDDAKALLAIIAEGCEDHRACEVCGRTLCPTCCLGDLSACDGPTYHCADEPACVASCIDCQTAYADEHGLALADDIDTTSTTH